MRISITTNLESVSTSFKEKLRSINKDEMLDEVAFYMENEMRKRFDTGTDYQGNAWAPLKLRKGHLKQAALLRRQPSSPSWKQCRTGGR